jgi:hypothetical protein
MKHFIVVLGSLVSLTGCSSTSGDVKAALSNAPDAAEVVCEGADCDEAWERAQLWIVNHSKCEILWALECIILTVKPPGNAPQYQFSVIKEPLDNGSYKIQISMYCGNMLGCDPKPEDVSRAFYHYVQTGLDLFDGVDDLGRGIQ